VRAARAQIGRVLVNLLGNAVRHTPACGKVVLRAYQEDSAPWVTLEVRDTGAGIRPEYLPRIFERFVQVPGATRGGAGLGLAIAQTIVQTHGAEIRAESKPGNGSTFSFRLPLAETRRQEMAAEAAGASGERLGTVGTEKGGSYGAHSDYRRRE
jgi:signal transduction histidine kinase